MKRFKSFKIDCCFLIFKMFKNFPFFVEKNLICHFLLKHIVHHLLCFLYIQTWICNTGAFFIKYYFTFIFSLIFPYTFKASCQNLRMQNIVTSYDKFFISRTSCFSRRTTITIIEFIKNTIIISIFFSISLN